MNFNLSCSIQLNNRSVSPILTYVLLIAGVHQLWKFLQSRLSSVWSELHGLWNGQSGSGYRGSIIQQSSIFNDQNWPSMKQIFRVLFRKRIPLLQLSPENQKKHVIIYGATSHMGQITSNIFIKYGYSVILIDANLQKLQQLKLQLLKSFVEQEAQILLMQFDMCIYKDSTQIEHMIRATIDVESMSIPIIANCSGYGGYWQVAEDKLYHEL